MQYVNKIRSFYKDIFSLDKDSHNISPVYVNRHKEKYFLIVGTGPSLKKNWKKIGELQTKYNLITMGANNIGDFIQPDYHCFTNKKRFINYSHTIGNKSKVLIGEHISIQVVKKHYGRYFEIIPYLNDHDASFNIENGIIRASCRTVGVLMIATAIVMGARKIFVVGMDGYKDIINTGSEIHFYSEKNSTNDSQNDYFLTIDYYNNKFLNEIKFYLESNNRESFSIVTPTTYQDNYCSIDQFL